MNHAILIGGAVLVCVVVYVELRIFSLRESLSGAMTMIDEEFKKQESEFKYECEKLKQNLEKIRGQVLEIKNQIDKAQIPVAKESFLEKFI